MYRYEMHIHSEPCSGGGDDIRRQIDVLIKRGYTGMVITNHFYYGDTRVDRALPWEEFVDAYRQDYLRGLEYAREKDFDLFFGIEEHVGDGLEVLCYGITPELLAAHPELRMHRVEDYIRIVHEAGGLIFQAHPYRDRYYITKPGPLPCLDELDGIEVYNAANTPEANERARKLATERGLRCTAGSDGHHRSSCGYGGVEFYERPRNYAEFIEMLRSGSYEIYRGKD